MPLWNGKVVPVIVLLTLLLGVVYCYILQLYRVIGTLEQTDDSQSDGFKVLANQGAETLSDRSGDRCFEASGRALGRPTAAPLQIWPAAEPVFRTRHFPLVVLDHVRYQQPSIVKGRTDVVTMTPWLAPVVWEGTFDPGLVDGIYRPRNVSVAATVFAVGKYIQFLSDFLSTAEQHFFVGFNVHVFVFTDRPDDVPQVKMAAGRQLTVRSVPPSGRWQEISARRMQLIQMLVEELGRSTDFIFCLDVDSKFHGRWGAESLGSLVAVIHPGYYRDERGRFPYERQPASRAYMGPEDGDFYYCGGAFGGALQEVHLLAKTCRANFEADAADGVEAAWQEESHLNRFMWTNKPSKVLSPEYLWQDFKARDPEVQIVRFSGVVKNYAEVRPNV